MKISGEYVSRCLPVKESKLLLEIVSAALSSFTNHESFPNVSIHIKIVIDWFCV